MIISFFEEFPTKENLSKLKLITWPTKLYLAANSLKEFNNIKSKIKNKNIKEFIYWPILKKEEGYWISPFSKRKALKRIFNELENNNTSVMIDSELPTTQNPLLYLTQSYKFFNNKRLIRNFIKNYKNIYTAEYYPQGKRKDKILSFLGLHFNPNKFNSKIIKMMYHSMHSFNKDLIIKELKDGIKNYNENFLIAYGTISTGIQKTEPILKLSQLKKDLEIAKQTGIKEVIIYRLEGLNKNYLRILKLHWT